MDSMGEDDGLCSDDAMQLRPQPRTHDNAAAAAERVGNALRVGITPATPAALLSVIQRHFPYPWTPAAAASAPAAAANGTATPPTGGGGAAPAAFFCTVMNAGCLAWRSLLLRAEGQHVEAGAIHHTYRQRHLSRYVDVAAAAGLDAAAAASRNRTAIAAATAAWVAFVAAPQVPRYFISRDPYVRLISAYVDSFRGERTSLGLDLSPDASFADLVRHLHSLWVTSGGGSAVGGSLSSIGVDPHFSEQTNLCGFSSGIQFDFVLDIDAMDRWYPCLVRTLNLSAVVRSGWAGPGGCFWRMPHGGCDLLKASDGDERGGVAHERVAADNDDAAARAGHHPGRAWLWEHYTPELIHLVNEIYARDFALLGYPSVSLALVSVGGAKHRVSGIQSLD